MQIMHSAVQSTNQLVSSIMRECAVTDMVYFASNIFLELSNASNRDIFVAFRATYRRLVEDRYNGQRQTF